MSPAIAAPFKIIITEAETPLVPNSVIDLAGRLGYYKQEGVEVELIRVQESPSAIAALRSGQGDMANVSFDVALQLVARNQMKLRGVISPDKALPFLIVASDGMAAPKALEGKVLGVARVGSVDYLQTRQVLTALGVDVEKLRYLVIGQPAIRVQALAARRIDATTVTVGTWAAMPDKSKLSVVVDAATYRKAAPFITKLSVVTEEIATSKREQVEAVVRATIRASRDFAADPVLWIEAMVAARPDIPRAQLAEMAEAYRVSWSLNGGLDPTEANFTTEQLYQSDGFKDLPRKVAPESWLDRRFIDAALARLGPTNLVGVE